MSNGKIPAKELIEDIRKGLDDGALMAKYQLSLHVLQRLFKQLIDRGFIRQEDIEQRLHVLTCPACRWSSQEVFEACPRCGVIVAKFRPGKAEAPKHPSDVSPSKGRQEPVLRYKWLFIIIPTVLLLGLMVFHGLSKRGIQWMGSGAGSLDPGYAAEGHYEGILKIETGGPAQPTPTDQEPSSDLERRIRNVQREYEKRTVTAPHPRDTAPYLPKPPPRDVETYRAELIVEAPNQIRKISWTEVDTPTSRWTYTWTGLDTFEYTHDYSSRYNRDYDGYLRISRNGRAMSIDAEFSCAEHECKMMPELNMSFEYPPDKILSDPHSTGLLQPVDNGAAEAIVSCHFPPLSGAPAKLNGLLLSYSFVERQIPEHLIMPLVKEIGTAEGVPLKGIRIEAPIPIYLTIPYASVQREDRGHQKLMRILNTESVVNIDDYAQVQFFTARVRFGPEKNVTVEIPDRKLVFQMHKVSNLP